jgi:hypothetical protein
MTTLRARFDGRVLVPEEPLDLPADSVVELQLTTVDPDMPRGSVLSRLADLAASFPPDPDAPVDGAAQHDHYLYGTPKRE